VNAIVRAALAGLSLALLASCLNVETSITLEDDHSGRVSVFYEIENELWDLGVFDPESSVRAFPVSEADFRRAARRVEGAELLDYSLSRGETVTTVEARLSFADLEALNGIYALGENFVSLAEDGESIVYRQRLKPDEEGYTVEDTEFVRTYFAGYSAAFTVRLPGEVSKTNLGEVVASKREVRVSLDLVEFLSRPAPVDWEIRYR
jgi:hypothetical protein